MITNYQESKHLINSFFPPFLGLNRTEKNEQKELAIRSIWKARKEAHKRHPKLDSVVSIQGTELDKDAKIITTTIKDDKHFKQKIKESNQSIDFLYFLPRNTYRLDLQFEPDNEFYKRKIGSDAVTLDKNCSVCRVKMTHNKCNTQINDLNSFLNHFFISYWYNKCCPVETYDMNFTIKLIDVMKEYVSLCRGNTQTRRNKKNNVVNDKKDEKIYLYEKKISNHSLQKIKSIMGYNNIENICYVEADIKKQKAIKVTNASCLYLQVYDAINVGQVQVQNIQNNVPTMKLRSSYKRGGIYSPFKAFPPKFGKLDEIWHPNALDNYEIPEDEDDISMIIS